jgi:hypothetical protein
LFAFGEVLFAEAGDGGDEFVDLVHARVWERGGFEELDGEEFFGGEDGGFVGRVTIEDGEGVLEMVFLFGFVMAFAVAATKEVEGGFAGFEVAAVRVGPAQESGDVFGAVLGQESDDGFLNGVGEVVERAFAGNVSFKFLGEEEGVVVLGGGLRIGEWISIGEG